MGIRGKLMLPLLLAYLVFVLIVNFYWFPQQAEKIRENFIHQQHELLTTIESDLTRHLLSGDLAALFTTLEFQMELRRPTWQSLNLVNDAGQQLYPLGRIEHSGKTSRFDILLNHPLEISGNRLGNIELLMNWKAYYNQSLKDIRDLQWFLLVAFALVFIFGLIWQNILVRNPLLHLQKAADKLADGEFDANLPASRRDEVGRLRDAFSRMRTSLLHAKEDQEEARTQAVAASQAKSDFLATMSHEIRTPMNGVLGLLQLLSDTQLNKQQREYVELIDQSGQTLLTVINDILDFSKIEAGKLDLDLVPFSLQRTAASVIHLLSAQAGDKGLNLELNYHRGCPQHFIGDPVRLHQVMLNLVGNAVKFTERGEVALIISCSPEHNDEMQVCIEVRDTGIGISTEAQQRLFAAFTQADNSTTRRFGGSGLGLAISKRLVELMQGHIELDTVKGSGSTFRAFIPLGSCVTTSEAGERTQRSESSNDSLKGLRVLLVEDVATNRMVATAMLKKQGIEVATAENGSQAADMAQHGHYDVILMDIRMPVMDGYEASAVIRSNEALGPSAHRTVIIALTANALESDRQACLDAGMDDFLSKPFTRDALYEILLRWSHTNDRDSSAAKPASL